MRRYVSVEKSGDRLLELGYDTATGRKYSEVVEFRPELYRPSKGSSEWRSLVGERPLERIEFSSMSAADREVERRRDGSLLGYENWVSQHVCRICPSDEPIDRSLLSIVAFDIETDSSEKFPDPAAADQRILTIAATSSRFPGKVFAYGYHEFDAGDMEGHAVAYRRCDSEEELIQSFLDEVWKFGQWCDAVTGWNTKFYDIPYLVNRMKVLGMDERQLSPWGIVKSKTVTMFNRPHQHYNIFGVGDLDCLQLLRQYGYSYMPQESFRLDDIANNILGKGKVEYSKQFSTLANLYKSDFARFVEYNIRDVLLVNELDAKIGMIDMALITQAGAAVGSLSRVLGTTQVWDGIIYKALRERKLVPPLQRFDGARKKARDRKPGDGEDELVGAYVKEPITGRHKWIVSFDVASMYPSVIMQNNLSPETMDGGCGRRGVVPELVDRIFGRRQEIKREMAGLAPGSAGHANLDNRQLVLKIQLNSLYGAFANSWFRYYDIRMANQITAVGQETIQACEKAVNAAVNGINGTEGEDYIVAMDTDSLYISLESYVDKLRGAHRGERGEIMKIVDAVSERVVDPAIRAALEQAAAAHGVENRMRMNREIVGSDAVWTAKKRYIVSMVSKDGRDAGGELKITGLESVRSSTPQICREKLKEAYAIVLDSDAPDEVQKFVAEFREEFRQLPPEDISFPRTVSEPDKYFDEETVYRKGTPQHVRAALMHNHHVRKAGLESRHRLIVNGDKVKFVSLVLPNPINTDIIAFADNSFPHGLFGEDGCRHIDYDRMFGKTFAEPLKHVLDAVGWELESRHSLFDV